MKVVIHNYLIPHVRFTVRCINKALNSSHFIVYLKIQKKLVEYCESSSCLQNTILLYPMSKTLSNTEQKH